MPHRVGRPSLPALCWAVVLIAALLAAMCSTGRGVHVAAARNAAACGHIGTLLGVLALSDTMLVGSTDGGAMVRSTDGGRCWTQARVQPFVAHRFGTIVQDPGDAGVLLAGSGSIGRVGFGANLGLLRSTDGGRSWNLMGHVAGLPAVAFSANALAATRTGLFVAVACDADLALIQASQPGRFACGRPIFRSVDHGRTWQPVGPGDGNVDPRYAGPPFDSSVLVMAAGNGAVYAIADPLTGAGGAYRSADNGATWRLMAPNPALADASSLTVLMHPQGVLLAGVGITADSAQILRSGRQGRSWAAVLPANRSHDSVIVGCAETGTPGVVYCAGLHHLFRSTDGGASWVAAAGAGLGTQPIAAFTALPNGNLIVAEYGGLFQSHDGGDHWSQLP